MAKLPAFQFYPGDWLKDPNLRRCTHAAKGVWMDILCLMFESQERGVLITAQRAWSDEEIALAVGGDSTTVMACVQELTLKGVAYRRADGALYSKRLIRDEQKRKLCVAAGKRGGNPNLTGTLKGAPKGEVKGPPNREPTPSASSSSSDEEIKKEAGINGKPHNLNEALAYAEKLPGYEPDIVKHWYACRDSADWERVNGTPVRNWRSDLDAWVLKSARDSATATIRRQTDSVKASVKSTRTSQYSW